MARVESALRRLDGVSEVDMDCTRSVVVLTPRARTQVDLALLSKTVEQSSDQGMRYQVHRSRIVATGTVEGFPLDPSLRICGWRWAYPLQGENSNLAGCYRFEAELIEQEGKLRLRILRILEPLATCS